MKKSSPTKVSKLADLISSKNFSWVDPNIIADLFPVPKILRTDYKLFHFNRYISSENSIKEMQKEGYEPANIYELLSWPDWNDNDVVVALGSVGKVLGRCYVPHLYRVGSGRYLSLVSWGVDWRAGFRFLAVRNGSRKLESGKSELGRLDSWTLGQLDAIEEIIKSIRNHEK